MKPSCFIPFFASAHYLLAASGALDQWQWRNPLPQGNNLASAAYDSGLFVTSGEKGTILTSPDGQTWAAQPSPTSADLFCAAHGSNLWVLVGAAGTILTSPDGTNWTSRTSGT